MMTFTSTATPVPQKTTILVIGGGPAGSSAATILQREGFDVTLLESSKFPRYHVGESMLPSLRNYLNFLGLKEEFEKHGFLDKPGGCFKLVRDLPESWTDFTSLGPGYATWNVIRSEMDVLLLSHSQREGVHVYDETKVQEILFENNGDPTTSRPISATWSRKDGTSGKIDFDWLIDASGRVGVMSTKYLRNREMRESLRNVAVWGYWKDVKRYGVGTKKENSAWFEALGDESGWAWCIPLHDGTNSIGIVMHQSKSDEKKACLQPDGTKPSLTEHYLDQLQYVPGVVELIGDKGAFIPGSTKSASDFSYSATRYSGDHFRIIGDAANFVDPFFSSGVHIAMTGALSAAVTICASIKGQIDEVTSQGWHDAKIGIAHTRFLIVVLCAYRQMHLQSRMILSDINAANFDSAFNMFRPVIFGLADSQKKLTDSRVSEIMEICQTFFDPTVHEEHVHHTAKRYGVDLVKLDSPVLGKQKIDDLVGADDVGARVLKKFDAVRVFSDDVEAVYMERHPLLGFRALIKRGQLGLIKVDEALPKGENDIIIAAVRN